MNGSSYLVSVVTPFHNAKLELFQQCVDSVRAQTIGFEHIEWIITLHNCEPEFVDAAREMTSAFDNIKLSELYNDFHTASTPRNECMKHVTSPYVFFLDADDYLFPEALERLRNTLEENGADVAACREESIVYGEGIQQVDHLRLRYQLDQTRPLIILHRDSPEMAQYLDKRNGTVHKMYRFRLIQEHALTFADDVRIGEDLTFNLRFLKHAERVAVLPQYIGYAYILNSGSLVQSSNFSSPETMLSMLRDFYAWLEAAANSGLDASAVGWTALAAAAKILSAPGMPASIVNEWRPRYAAYADSFAPPKAGAKSYSEQEAAGIMQLVKSYFAGGDAVKVNDNEQLLYSILSRNEATDIGLNHHFERIRSYASYRQFVPLSDYAFYAPLVNLTTRIGEYNIFSAERPVGYSLTSGSTGPAKRIPYTTDHLQTYIDALRDVLSSGAPTFALLESFPKEMEYVDGGVLDSIIGATLTAIRLELVDCSYAKRFKQGSVTSPLDLLFPEEVIDPRYPRLLFALIDRDVSQIVAPFTWTLLDIMQFLEKHHAQLVEDIARGEISYTTDLPENVRTKLQAKLTPDPARAEQLREIFSEGFENIISRLWPACRRIVSAGTGAFSLYTRKLAFYSGDIPLSNGYFAASEAMIGRTMEDGSDEYALLTDNAFFEFLEPGAEEPVAVDGIAVGHRYELILTNTAGLYRYRLGDVIQIERIENGVPIFTYAYRLDESIRLGNVTVTEDEIEVAVPAIEAASGSDIRDFCAMAEDDHLVILVEPAPSASELKNLLTADPEKLGAAADQELCSRNSIYRSARDEGKIAPAQVRVLEPETQLAYRDRTMFTERVAPDQLKPVRALNTEEKLGFFTVFAAQK